MARYEWYEVIQGNDIQQGDFVLDLAVPVVPNTYTETPGVELETYDTVVITQSCDIPKVQHLVLCPIWEVSQAAKLHPDFAKGDGLEKLRKGLYVAFHLLNRCDLPEFRRDYTIVQFDRLIVLPKSTVEQHVAQQPRRFRLLPPYREHLAQAFARFFMRVGLPIDIPPFTK